MSAELSYSQLAEQLGVSDREVRNLCKKHKVSPVAYSYKNRRFPAWKIKLLKSRMAKAAQKRWGEA